MKKRLSIIMALLMAVMCFAACGETDGNTPAAGEDKASAAAETGGDEDKGEEAEPVEAVEQTEEAEAEAQAADTYWTCVKCGTEEMEITEENAEPMFGTPVDQIMTLCLRGSGIANICMLGEANIGTWTEENGAIELSLAGQIMKGTIDEAGETLVLAAEPNLDGMEYTLELAAEAPDYVKNIPGMTFDPCFSVEKTEAMSNMMNEGIFVVQDSIIYGVIHRDGNPSLGAIPFEDSEDAEGVTVGESTILIPDVYARYLNYYEDRLYFTLSEPANEEMTDGVYSIKPNGSDIQQIYGGVSEFLTIYKDRLYFTDAEHHLVSCNPDGSDMTTIVEKDVYYTYPICDNWYIYQDDADGEKIKLFCSLDGSEYPISAVDSFVPIIYGTDVYYTAQPDLNVEEFYITKTNLLTFETEVSENPLDYTRIVIYGDKIMATGDNRVGIDMWNTLKQLEISEGDEVLEYDYVSEDYTISVYRRNGLFSSKFIIKNSTGKGESFN